MSRTQPTFKHLCDGSSCVQVLDQCADGMVFGALKPCSDCGGQLVAHTHRYQCTGNISAWTKCTFATTEPERQKWVIPDDFLEVPFLCVAPPLPQ